MNYYVYVIRNAQGRLYTGVTLDLDKRVEYHNKGWSRWTKGKGPWELVYRETQPSKKDALTRELFLKSGRGRDYLKGLVAVHNKSV